MTAETERTYKGLPGAFRYAFVQSDSLVFRLYVLVSALLGLLVGILFAFALIVLVADTLAAPEGSLSLLRSFFVLVGLLVVLPIVAPVLFVARRHRRKVGDDAGYDRQLALTGLLFIASLFVGLVISTPPDQQASTDGVLGPLLELLYALPATAGFVPPVATAALMYLVHRRSR
ncbi:hypothetical protein [Natronobiforma cellulositropha]|uniref:hypothetical protein n=1 Tax=Natronobiforma cellulositropha TaxID=1679076 RepID=UPI0021D606EA|nr:hypothetical protein [Natronobiforma cellulositropha]